MAASNTYNPHGYDLNELDRIGKKFYQDDLIEVAVKSFVENFNKINVDNIVAWQYGYDGSDFMDNHVTFIFYLDRYAKWVKNR